MLAARLLSASDREAIVGDLLEEAAWRGLRGTRREWWLAGQCVGIAIGLTAERARAACSLSLVREVASGMAVEGERMLRGTAPRTLLIRVVLFAGGVAALACAGEILISALIRSAGL